MKDTKTMPVIRLECDWEPSWEDAKTRLKVAAEVLDFPFHIAADETACAVKNLVSHLNHGGYEDDEIPAAEHWFKRHTTIVRNFPEALAALYPWFHDGESMPK